MMNAMENHNSFAQSEELFHEMMTFLANKESKRLDLSGIEEFLIEQGRTLCRQLLVAHLAERGVGDVGASVIGADGVKRTHKRLLKRTLLTVFGPLVIRRLAYSKSTISSLFPLDAMLNLPPHKISYTLQKHFVLEVIDRSFQKSSQSIARWTGVTITNRQAQAIVQDASQEFAKFYDIRVMKEAEEARNLPLLILTSDGKGVFVKIDDLRPATRKKARQKRREKKACLSHAEQTYSKRIATVASVYEIARYIRQPSDIAADFFSQTPPVHTQEKRPKPCAKRVWAGLEASGKAVVETIFREALHRGGHQNKEWVVLVDGELNQIKHFQQMAETFHIALTIVCDMVHVLRYLWNAGKAFYPHEAAAHWVSEKLQEILHGNSRRVAAGMRRWATRRQLAKSVREPIDDCARYLVNHAPYLQYHRYLKKGYPIATGVIEGTCRYLVKDRMEITGARWGLQGAEALLKLRAIHTSGDFDEYWQFYQKKQYEKHYKILYKNPDDLQPKNLLSASS
jgi:hypothetical protein